MGILTGYEAESVIDVEAVLDDSPADASEVYLRTMGQSERAIAAVAAKRAGGGGGGFTPVHTNEEITGDDVSIDDNAGPSFLTFSHQSGDTLLDYSDPTKPVFIETGLYAIYVLVVCDDGVQASGWFDSTLFVARQSSGPSPDVEIATDLSLGIFPFTALNMTIYLEAGDGFQIAVSNGSGLGGALNFAVSDGLIQRIY